MQSVLVRSIARSARKSWRQAHLGLRIFLSRTMPRPLLFSHIPKCAGTSIADYLASNYRPSEVFSIQRSHDRGETLWENLPSTQRAQYRLLIGHTAHGVRDTFHRDAFRLTVFREPVDRIVSHYYFAKSTPSHYLHERIHASGMSLYDYVKSDLSVETTNYYAWHFGDFSPEASNNDPLGTADKVEQILVAQYSLIGFTDALDPAMTAVATNCKFTFPWKQRRMNTTGARTSSIDEKVRDAITERNRADVRLYQMLCRRAGERGFIKGHWLFQ
jgi:hypothetical protein